MHIRHTNGTLNKLHLMVLMPLLVRTPYINHLASSYPDLFQPFQLCLQQPLDSLQLDVVHVRVVDKSSQQPEELV